MMFTPHQADAVRRALRRGLDREGPPSQGLDARLRDALADAGRARFTADQKDDVKSALRDEKNLRVSLGAALAGPDGKPTADVDGPAMPPMPPKEPVLPEPTSPKVGAGMDGSAHSFQGYGRKVSADGGDPTFCWSL